MSHRLTTRSGKEFQSLPTDINVMRWSLNCLSNFGAGQPLCFSCTRKIPKSQPKACSTTRRSKLAALIRAQTGANHEDDARVDSVIPISVFNPVSLFRGSGLGTTVPACSNHAMSTISHTSSTSGLVDIDGSSLRVPDEPAEVAFGKIFTCAICSYKLCNIKSQIDW